MSRTIIARGAAWPPPPCWRVFAAYRPSAAPAEDGGAGVETPAEEDPEEGEADDTEDGEESEADDAEETAEDDSASEDDESGRGERVGIRERARPPMRAVTPPRPRGPWSRSAPSVTDEETGDVITVVSAVRHNPTEYYEATDNPDGEMVYLEVAVTPGDTYGGSISQSDFYLGSDGEEIDYAASADDELIDAGYEYFDGPARRDGEATGYIPIYLETTGDTLKGAYVRPEMKILGEDTTVPEFRGEFEVPAA